jgi:hypothetical protein
MVDARRFALSWILISACAAAPTKIVRPQPERAQTQPPARADALSMRDLRGAPPKDVATLGVLQPVRVGTESLSKQATAK